MSIHSEVLELAKKIGAPAVGSNVQETIKSINVYLGGTTHGANIQDTIEEFKRSYSGGGGPYPNYIYSKGVDVKVGEFQMEDTE